MCRSTSGACQVQNAGQNPRCAGRIGPLLDVAELERVRRGAGDQARRPVVALAGRRRDRLAAAPSSSARRRPTSQFAAWFHSSCLLSLLPRPWSASALDWSVHLARSSDVPSNSSLNDDLPAVALARPAAAAPSTAAAADPADGGPARRRAGRRRACRRRSAVTRYQRCRCATSSTAATTRRRIARRSRVVTHRAVPDTVQKVNGSRPTRLSKLDAISSGSPAERRSGQPGEQLAEQHGHLLAGQRRCRGRSAGRRRRSRRAGWANG